MAEPVAIPVSKGNVAYVDEADYEQVSRHRWYVLTAPRSLTKYARTTINRKTVYLHRMIMNPPEHLVIDHIDGDGLNNTRENLRVTTHSDNIGSIASRRAYDEWQLSLAQK
jgi:hypothetical protein